MLVYRDVLEKPPLLPNVGALQPPVPDDFSANLQIYCWNIHLLSIKLNTYIINITKLEIVFDDWVFFSLKLIDIKCTILGKDHKQEKRRLNLLTGRPKCLHWFVRRRESQAPETRQDPCVLFASLKRSKHYLYAAESASLYNCVIMAPATLNKTVDIILLSGNETQ